MKRTLRELKRAIRPKTNSIRTTVLDLLKELTKLTKDDVLVVAAMKSIFDSYDVRLARSMAPIRVVIADRSRRVHRRVGRVQPAQS